MLKDIRLFCVTVRAIIAVLRLPISADRDEILLGLSRQIKRVCENVQKQIEDELFQEKQETIILTPTKNLEKGAGGLSDRLTIDPNVSEHPIVKGTWVTVPNVVSMIVDGWSWSNILRSYPELTEDDLRACLAYKLEHDENL